MLRPGALSSGHCSTSYSSPSPTHPCLRWPGRPASRPPHQLQSCLRWRLAAAASGSTPYFSPSKVNLFLRIMGKRSDGYHNLASLFHVISLGDEMHFTPLDNAEADTLTCNMEGVPTDSTNLVIKALDLFRRRSGTSAFFSVHLEKMVPHGAGLGGGSANAATALWAANEHSGRPASTQQLIQWSGEIGSDISVFFSNGAAYCTGRGEIVEDVKPPLPLDMPLLLVKPPEGLATPDVFRALDLTQRSSVEPRSLLRQLAEEGVSTGACVNDLEQPAFDCMPKLCDLKLRLQTESGGQFHAVVMTGSGSTIICFGSDKAPSFLLEPQYAGMFVAPARLLVRRPNEWYQRAA